MDLQLQAGFTVSESGFGFVIRMHFFTESETRFGVNPNPDSIIEYALRQQQGLTGWKEGALFVEQLHHKQTTTVKDSSQGHVGAATW